MKSLHLNIKDGIWIDLLILILLEISHKLLFLRPLNRLDCCQKRLIVQVLHQLLKLCRILLVT